MTNLINRLIRRVDGTRELAEFTLTRSSAKINGSLYRVTKCNLRFFLRLQSLLLDIFLYYRGHQSPTIIELDSSTTPDRSPLLCRMLRHRVPHECVVTNASCEGNLEAKVVRHSYLHTWLERKTLERN